MDMGGWQQSGCMCDGSMCTYSRILVLLREFSFRLILGLLLVELSTRLARAMRLVGITGWVGLGHGGRGN